ncbi:hypothetical protein [Pontibacter sp. G13]|uniref:hypothetical protein n=1 Tax=Pontibacter sp. G13 TaxID=3074898 RepID=UPI00288AC95D|nr:hypothetical protein [Pontibacter sp. G13]WNJ18072.1 hypothetical protein RJD25_24715 [Pontibacter sp. G13]
MKGLKIWMILWCLGISVAQAQPKAWVLGNVQLIDVRADQVSEPMYVWIQDESIQAVAKSLEELGAPTGTPMIDGAGKYLMPGMWDMEVRDIDDPRYFAFMLANGVTQIRLVVEDPAQIRKLRREAEVREDYQPDWVIDGLHVKPARAEDPFGLALGHSGAYYRQLDSLLKLGITQLDISGEFSVGEYVDLSVAARDLGLRLGGEIPKEISTAQALAAGHRIFTNGSGLTAQDRSMDARALLKEMAEDSVWLIPNLALLESYLPTTPQVDSLPLWLSLTESKARWFFQPIKIQRPVSLPSISELSESWWDQQLSSIETFVRAGGKCLAGTMSPNPQIPSGYSIHRELELLVSAGLTPAEALKTAIANPAEYMASEGLYGAIAKDHVANLVLLSGNPLEDIHNTREIAAVIHHGNYLSADSLEIQLRNLIYGPEKASIEKEMMAVLQQSGVEAAITFYQSNKDEKNGKYRYEEEALNLIGYSLLYNVQDTDAAIKIFKLYTDEYPGSANAYDSLGEAYLVGQKWDEAEVNYRKSLQINPYNSNAVAKLKELSRFRAQMEMDKSNAREKEN